MSLPKQYRVVENLPRPYRPVTYRDPTAGVAIRAADKSAKVRRAAVAAPRRPRINWGNLVSPLESSFTAETGK